MTSAAIGPAHHQPSVGTHRRVRDQPDEQDGGQIGAQHRLSAVGDHGTTRHAPSDPTLATLSFVIDQFVPIAVTPSG